MAAFKFLLLLSFALPVHCQFIQQVLAGGQGFLPDATPTFSPGAGTYSSTQSVTISTITSGATLCYTTDGTTPTATVPGTCDGNTYSTALSVSTSQTIKAIATKLLTVNSAVGSAAYVISPGITKVCEVSAGASSSKTVSTAAANCASATHFVMVESSSAGCTVGDSTNANTWHALTTYGGVPSVTIYYAEGATGNASQTFTCTNATLNIYPSVVVIGFTGVASSSSFDKQNGNSAASGTSMQPGSTGTLSVANELIVTGCGLNASSTSNSINDSFNFTNTNLVDLINFSSGVTYGVLAGYLVQAATTALDPTWTVASQSATGCAIATFEP